MSEQLKQELDTVNSIKEKLKELINEMSGELASRLLESYANMPT